MSDTYAQMKERGRRKFAKRIRQKQKANSPDWTALNDEPNDRFVTQHFRDHHLVVGDVEAAQAIAKAVQANRDKNTTLFLDDGEFSAIVEEIKAFHRRAVNTGGNFTLFTTDGVYSYIDVDMPVGGPPVASAPASGRIRFSMQRVGHVDLGNGQRVPIHALHHLDQMYPVGQQDEGEDSGEDGPGSESDEDP